MTFIRENIKEILTRIIHPLRKQNPFFDQPQNYSTLFKKIKEYTARQMNVGLIYFDIVHFHEVNQQYGTTMAARLIRMLQRILEEQAPRFLRQAESVTVHNLWADDFIILFAIRAKPAAFELNKMAVTLYLEVKEHLQREVPLTAAIPLDLHVGYALIPPSKTGKDFQLYLALKEAQKMAKGAVDLRTIQLLGEFNEIIDHKRLTIKYQPIVSLNNGEILGWEALARGPAESYFHSPGVLFPFAEKVDLLYPLEKISRELAISEIDEISPDQKLFININTRTINDPNFVKGATKNLLQDHHLTPHNIVFEITERFAINDFASFNHTLEHYRSQGYMIAVDDAGAGYSSLQTIAEIRPDFIKMDMSLVRGINHSPVKKALLETFVTFAQKIGSAIVTEGIETEEELTTLMAMGIHYGQGFYLARPAFPKPEVEVQALLRISRSLINNRFQPNLRQSLPIGNILESSLQVSRGIQVREVQDILDTNDPVSGVVVVDENRPLGLVMRHHLYRYLGKQYGAALYLDRPIETLMDGSPLIVDVDTPIEEVAQAAMNRERIKLYDYIVVAKDKHFRGTVSVQNLLDTMTRIKIELARGANPLTGLPGNLRIEEEIDFRLKSDIPFTVIYADLDNFKSFNDNYSFDAGDQLILFTAKIIGRALSKYGNGNDFLGHLGGDDFFFITSPNRVEQVCRRIIKIFDRLIPGFYNSEDRTKKMIQSYNRSGQASWFPLVSISMGVIECLPGQYATHIQVAEVAAELKHYAKKQQGSIYVNNRRNCKPPDEGYC